jgi:type IV pilus assembly protein PilB
VIDRITMSLYARQPEVDRRAKAESTPSTGEQAIGAFVIEVLRYAMETGASDIHLEPRDDRTRVRLRVGGILETFHAKSCPAIRSVVDHIKSRSKLDVFDRLTPQTGFLKVRSGNHQARFRVRTCPINTGEKLVIRLLSQNQTPQMLSELGFSEKQLCDVQDTLAHSSGLVLVGGPARSGRRTTMYSCLRKLNEAHANIYTIEDSIHWNLAGAHQIQTREAEGFDIVSALETCSEQDPDAVLVQEIASPNVANGCAKMAMEGRLVFASIAARDSLSCISHLSEMGVRPTLLAHSLRMVISQRLVRKLCDCKTKHIIDRKHAVRWNIDQDASIYQSAGCDRCRGTGFRGQRPVFEVLHIGSRLQHMIQSGEPIEAIRHACLEGGTETLLQNARQCVLSGETSLEEIQRLDTHI